LKRDKIKQHMTEKISVVIITRNRSKMLEDCLESLIKQTHLPDEIIVVDNASTDNTKEIVALFSSRDPELVEGESRSLNSSRRARTIAPTLPIKYILEKKIGIPYARNRGINEAKGSILLMLDDDCVADKFWVERMVEAHKNYPKAWAIQGRTYSLPKNGMYSLLVESDRLLWLLSYKKKLLTLNKMKSFFSKDFKSETTIFTCDTKNFSVKTSYLINHKLSFDTQFSRGSDTDFGWQILQKKGLIMFYPHATVGHWERSSLTQFLEQYWHIGRTDAKIVDKWKTPSLASNIPRLKTLFALFLFCQHLNQLHRLPILVILLFLDRLYRINGWFNEKITISFAKH